METAAAQIEIGGPIGRSGVNKLLGAAGEDHAAADWSIGFDRDEVMGAIRERIHTKRSLALMADAAAWGELDSLKDCCRELGLTYRHGDYPLDTRPNI